LARHKLRAPAIRRPSVVVALRKVIFIWFIWLWFCIKKEPFSLGSEKGS